MNKTRIALLAAAMALPGIALAADLPVKASAYMPAPLYNWSGFYAGVHGGYGWGDNKFYDDVLPLAGKYDTSGGFGGVQVGYNSHFAPHWLIGGEFDFSAGDISDTGSFPGGWTGRYKADRFGTARTRFGYVVDRSLLYVTGGVAWMHDKSQLISGGGNVWLSSNQYSVGWVIGGGWEYAIDSRWSARIEYLYADFDKTRDVAHTIRLRSFDPTMNMVRAGLNYSFGDMPGATAYMPVKAVAPRSGWDGGYLGLHGGYGWANFRVTDDIFLTPTQHWDLKPSGGFGGFQSGANWMVSPNWLFGLETDASYGSLKDDGATAPSGFAISSKVDALGTLRARFGYVVDRTLLYVTGGGAYAHAKATLTAGGATGVSKENYFGWALGGGVEYKFSPEWSAKLEYIYMDLGKNSFDRPVAGLTRSSDMAVNTVKFGINYSGPVLERLFAAR